MTRPSSGVIPFDVAAERRRQAAVTEQPRRTARRAYTRTHGEDAPEIRDWTWEATRR